MSQEVCLTKKFQAEVNKLTEVQDYVLTSLSELSLDSKIKNQLMIVIEEIFVNVASYAYETSGDVEIKVCAKNREIKLSFIDSGYKFNPLDKEDPNVNAKAEERRIGGLGIFMVKNLMDDVSYSYIDNNNILTLTKNY